jgi:hypothetical protein
MSSSRDARDHRAGCLDADRRDQPLIADHLGEPRHFDLRTGRLDFGRQRS